MAHFCRYPYRVSTVKEEGRRREVLGERGTLVQVGTAVILSPGGPFAWCPHTQDSPVTFTTDFPH